MMMLDSTLQEASDQNQFLSQQLRAQQHVGCDKTSRDASAWRRLHRDFLSLARTIHLSGKTGRSLSSTASERADRGERLRAMRGPWVKTVYSCFQSREDTLLRLPQIRNSNERLE